MPSPIQIRSLIQFDGHQKTEPSDRAAVKSGPFLGKKCALFTLRTDSPHHYDERKLTAFTYHFLFQIARRRRLRCECYTTGT